MKVGELRSIYFNCQTLNMLITEDQTNAVAAHVHLIQEENIYILCHCQTVTYISTPLNVNTYIANLGFR